MKVIYQKEICRNDAKCNPAAIYIFGDNDARNGFGGLAKQIRGEPNAMGIRVKKLPTLDENAFYSDEELDSNIKKIAEDITYINYHTKPDTIIVFPMDGIGTGLAWLRQKAPKTFKYLSESLEKNYGITNGIKP